MCNQLNIQTRKGIVVRTAWALLFCLPFVTGISLTPCGSDGVQELLADQETHFICTAEGPVQWRLQLSKTTIAYFLAVCDQQCVQLDTVNELFIARRTDAHRSAMIVKPASNPLIYNNIQYLNGNLGCSVRDVDNMSAWCGLNYVAPPKNVSCTATNVSWSVSVSCTVASVFSSRKSYRCQLILLHDLSKNKTIANMTMATSSSNEHITKSEVKVSGFCLFNTILPSEKGLYGFYVSVSPGGQYFSASHKRFANGPRHQPHGVAHSPMC
ncbi:uncharacterized protein LOC112568651 [Pomacea canaliculata]|uniref:uncharacterized protein LOC112568651 n=1 Tax=Pomacea canaliculata TaxID=400727 RepID=UPI000D730EFC|nr:uncharacterized protein LOC112568651 [Pomacea canaliculata]